MRLKSIMNSIKRTFRVQQLLRQPYILQKTKEILQKKISTPVFHSNEIKIEEQIFPYDRISPELAQLLEKTEVNSFTPIILDNKGSFVSFYLKEIQKPSKSGYNEVKEQIANLIMGQKREQVLSDYFARLKGNADIQIIRKEEIDAGPKEFALKMGFVFVLISFMMLILGEAIAAVLVVGVLAICAFLEVAFNYCIGCQIYMLLKKFTKLF